MSKAVSEVGVMSDMKSHSREWPSAGRALRRAIRMNRDKELLLSICERDQGIKQAAFRLAEYILDIPCIDRRRMLITQCLKDGTAYLKSCMRQGRPYSLDGFVEAATNHIEDVLMWTITRNGNDIWDAFCEPLQSFVGRATVVYRCANTSSCTSVLHAPGGLGPIVRDYMRG